jgi:TP901 family phage tail tape measure protein
MAKTLETSVEISGVLSPSLQAAIKNAVNKLEEMSKETLEAAGAAEKLAAEISTQESVLKSLERGYADYVVSGEEGSEEAQQLAQHIQELSNELDENRDTLSAAQDAAEKLAAGMDDAENEADDLDSSMNEAARSAELADQGFTVFKATLANLAADAIHAAIDGLKDLAGNVLELGKNFTSTMSEVQAISGATGDELETLESCAREYGATTTFSASEAAEALKYMALAGWDVDQSTSALGGVLNLAAASGMELGAASDIVTDYLSAFGMEADQAAYFADLLASAQSSSNTTAEALGEAYKNCAANLNAAGQDVETVTSLLEGMANQGYKGSEAGTALAAIMRDITNAMDDGQIKIGDTSVAVMDAQGNFRDLTDILTEVEAATNGMGDAERAVALSSTFTADSTKGLNLILNEGMDSIAGYEENLKAAGGTAEEMAATMNDNLNGDLAQMNSAWEELGLKIYEKFEEPLRKAVQFVTSNVIPTIEWLMGYLPEIGAAIGGVGVVITALQWNNITKKLTMVKGALKGVVSALGGISSPAMIIVGVIAALAAGFAYLWKTNEDFRDKVTDVWDKLKGSFEQLGQSIGGMIEKLAPLFQQIAETLMNTFARIAEAVLPVLVDLIGAILPVIIDLIDQLIPILTTIVEGVLNSLIEILNQVLPVVVQIIETVLPVLVDLINELLPVFSAIVETVLSAMADIISQLLPLFMQVIEAVLPVLLQFVQALLPIIVQIVQQVLPVFVQLINAILPILMQIIQAVLPMLVQFIQTLLPIIVQLIESVLPVIVQLLNTIVPIVMQIIQAVLPILIEVLNMLTPILDMIVSLLQPILNLIIAVVQPILNLIMTAISPLIEIFTTLITTVLQPIQPILSALATIFTSVLGAAIESLKPIVEALTQIFQGLIDFITGVFSGSWSDAWNGVVEVFGGLWDGLVAIVKAPINAVIGLINGAINALNGISVTIPDWVPLVGGQTFGINIPNIPLLATGGFTDGVSIAGEAGTEAVISFDPAYRDENIKIWEKAGRMLGAISSEEQGAGLTAKAGELLTMDDFSLGTLAGNGGTVIYYDFSGFTWSPQIQVEGTDEPDDFMARLREHEAEFFDWLEEFIQMREVAQYA